MAKAAMSTPKQWPAPGETVWNTAGTTGISLAFARKVARGYALRSYFPMPQ